MRLLLCQVWAKRVSDLFFNHRFQLIFQGYFDVRITVETSGGHSSVPPDHTGIGILSQIISAVEAEPYEPELTPANR